MKTKLLVLLTFLVFVGSIYAQGTAFTYQGRLNDGTNLANGSYDIRFAVQGDPLAQVPLGQPRTNSAVTVSNGLFTTVVDFGSIWDGTPMWLDIGLRPAGSALGFTPITPRQLVTATPKAVYANRAGIYSGPIDVQQLPAGVVRGYADQTLTGAFTFDPLSGKPPFSVNSGVLVTNLNADKLDGLDAGAFWLVGGNANPVPPILGTASTQPLQFVVGNRRGLQLEIASANIARFTTLLSVNVIGGASGNVVSNGVFGGTIGGGGNITVSQFSSSSVPNVVSDDYGTVGGGLHNIAGNVNDILNDAQGATVSGGVSNIASGAFATVSGGLSNSASGPGAFIGGGGHDGQNLQGNTASGPASVIGGGVNNFALSTYTTVAGGAFNNAEGYYSTVGGGFGNHVGNAATIAGGFVNTAMGEVATIAGGNQNIADFDYATISGGQSNLADAGFSVIAGGLNNSVYSEILGFSAGSSASSAIGGGENNSIGPRLVGFSFVDATHSAISGGAGNVITGGSYASIPGGRDNFVGGDFGLAAGRRAKAFHNGCFVWGDSTDADFGSTATDQFLVRANGGARFWANNHWDVNNSEGDFRIGTDDYRLKIGVALEGSGRGDIWIRAQGGTARMFLKTPGGTTIFSDEGQTHGVSLAAGGGAWTTVSDRNAKENFAAVNARDVLEKVAALPVQTWNYKTQAKSIRHIGPMAQDFSAAFSCGETNTGITTVDADGVALAAIQGLNQKLEEKEARVAALEKTVAELQKAVATLMRGKR